MQDTITIIVDGTHVDVTELLECIRDYGNHRNYGGEAAIEYVMVKRELRALIADVLEMRVPAATPCE